MGAIAGVVHAPGLQRAHRRHLPFGAVFIELFFILTSMWLHQFYYLFGFLCLVFVILIITCAEITIVLCYFQLCSEDYHWWCVLFSLTYCPSRCFPAACPYSGNSSY